MRGVVKMTQPEIKVKVEELLKKQIGDNFKKVLVLPMQNIINVYIQVADGCNYVNMDDELEELEDMLEGIGYENAMISASPEIEII
jgi:hypothetical protein